jgi:hypothetical protein
MAGYEVNDIQCNVRKNNNTINSDVIQTVYRLHHSVGDRRFV